MGTGSLPGLVAWCCGVRPRHAKTPALGTDREADNSPASTPFMQQTHAPLPAQHDSCIKPD
jgi:hypothetical protein